MTTLTKAASDDCGRIDVPAAAPTDVAVATALYRERRV
jgi:hypothetical protein